MDKKLKDIEPMSCPVCDEFYFDKLNEIQKELGIRPNECQCPHCGWLYDLEQVKNPNMGDGANKMSLNQYKANYMRLLAIDPKYDFSNEHKQKPQPHICPVCGAFEFSDVCSFEICPNCGWEDDDTLEGGNANPLSAEETKKQYLKAKNNK